MADATQALKAVGDVAGPLESDTGLVVLRLTARQLGFDQSFDSVKPRIVSRLQLEKRSRAMDDYVAPLRKLAKVEVNDSVLDKVEVRPEGSTAGAKR